MDKAGAGIFCLHSTGFDDHEVDIPVRVHFFRDGFGEAFEAEFAIWIRIFYIDGFGWE